MYLQKVKSKKLWEKNYFFIKQSPVGQGDRISILVYYPLISSLLQRVVDKYIVKKTTGKYRTKLLKNINNFNY
jgi:hypothetical protein